MFVGLFSVSEEVSKKDQRQGDAEPHGADTKHGGEGYCSTWVFAPDEEVDENSDTKYYSRIQGSGQQGSSLNSKHRYKLYSSYKSFKKMQQDIGGRGEGHYSLCIRHAL